MQESFKQSGDYSTAALVDDLLKQSGMEQLAVAFCGHFSAGKSTLINTLCGMKLLPSSPIPTSANVVAIKHGEPGAAVVRRSQEQGGTALIDRVELEHLAAFCRNGKDIESVEIRYPVELLGGEMLFLDTPGIDSTDEEHLASTLASLYKADAVFYVMDYNHVQSEVNFSFARRLKEWGKPLYLIINQIDKHKEIELPFEQYKKSVRQAFADWEIDPDGILYLSLKQPGHSGNEWHKLIWLLEKLKEQRGRLRSMAVEASAEQLINRHMEFYAAKEDARRQELLAQSDDGTHSLLESRAKLLESQMEALKLAPQQLLETGKQEITAIIGNANLIPADIRDLAADFLLSMAPNFKVGWLGSKAKTEHAIQARRTRFLARFQEQIDIDCGRHIGEALKRLAEQNDVGTDSLEVRLLLPADWPQRQIKAGADFGGAYTMNYARDMSDEAKRAMRSLALEALERLAAAAERKAQPQISALQEESALVGRRLQALTALEEMQRQAAIRREELMKLLEAQEDGEQRAALPDPRLAPEKAASPRVLEETPVEAALQADAAVAAAGISQSAESMGGNEQEESRFAAGEVIGAVREAVRALQAIPATASLRRSLSERAERMEQETFSVVLFGAFSAGKSSFANALIGQSVLPVSPNPTTAAVCKLLPPQQEWPHGTARIQMKTYEQLLEEIRFSLSALGLELDERQDLPEQLQALEPSQITAKGKPHYSFLQAVLQGYEEAKKVWGGQLKVDLETFNRYAADETKSCFVDGIELFFNCPLTQQGMVLVDTPGADSIHARHTGVAFDYIKHADAILFVTYYNHAFSQADKEFLTQLGRVKEQFELDKMFFIINAADLASETNELEAVEAHVAENLQSQGIRKPRIHSLSSMQALQASEAGDLELLRHSRKPLFDRDFVRFRRQELLRLAVRSILAELDRAIHLVAERLQAAGRDREEKRLRAGELEADRAKSLALIKNKTMLQEEKDLAEEIKTLFFYVNQRMQHRFGEFYNLAFHPGVLSGSVSDYRIALRSAWSDLYRMLSYGLSQEILATALRVEVMMEKLGRRWNSSIDAELGGLLEGYTQEHLQELSFRSAKVEETIAAELDEKLLSKHFKNPRSFFEGSGKQQLREALEQQAMEAIRSFSRVHEQRFAEHYLPQLREQVELLKRRTEESVVEHSEGLLSAYQDERNVESWRRSLERLRLLKHGIISKT